MCQGEKCNKTAIGISSGKCQPKSKTPGRRKFPVHGRYSGIWQKQAEKQKDIVRNGDVLPQYIIIEGRGSGLAEGLTAAGKIRMADTAFRERHPFRFWPLKERGLKKEVEVFTKKQGKILEKGSAGRKSEKNNKKTSHFMEK